MISEAEGSSMAQARGTFSSWIKATSGVSQGSVLRPLSFLIYVNYSPEELESYLNMFPDDAKVKREERNGQDCNYLQRC